MNRIAQLLLVLSAAALWVASRFTWVEVRSFDGLGQPKTSTLSGAAWSTALIPLALVVLAAAVAVLAVRGWLLRLLAVLVAAASAGMAYLAISLWIVTDVAPRAADLAEVPVADLTGTHRYFTGAIVTLMAAACALVGAVLLMRAARSSSGASAATARYAAPAARREAAQQERSGETPEDGMSERMIWDALDEGHDPTNPDTKGR
ncbi:TIGR02234 family membrane protein [Mycolicibacterium sp. S2-37]|uniref:TIGR02234 family membrane protein n=1 Tax=Mycolicibacterium sp. S2-37 TaxID=2810297 RepID=UPI001A940B09|nr:TIGR02234 family membrane protein [Mycolicibacterium sp. S2-37]MBO0676356.1 TIGR02234 family membrane protein [Mycolicibacterium sp. S2-37]